MNLLEAHNISVIRQNKRILNHIDLTVGEHDFITIVGPNGAGKTTLMQCLMGFYPPEEGKIIRASNIRMGYVPQRIQRSNGLPITAKSFLMLGQHLKTPDEMDFFARICEETQVSDFLGTMLHSLSGGEVQRVLLARALLRRPTLLMLDEPAQNLDFNGQIAFYKLIEKIYERRKISIVMVSHDLHLVMASTRRVICLFHHICCSGEPHLVTQDPEFQKIFGGDIAKMMAVYHHEHHHHHHADGMACTHHHDKES